VSDQSKLLPCPFCGTTPVQFSKRVEFGGGVGNRLFAVQCQNKRCKIKPNAGEYGPDDFGRAGEWLGAHATNEIAGSEALRAWNSREPMEVGT
jgi:hypothetical protein